MPTMTNVDMIIFDYINLLFLACHHAEWTQIWPEAGATVSGFEVIKQSTVEMYNIYITMVINIMPIYLKVLKGPA